MSNKITNIFTKITNKFNPNLKDNKSQDFLSEIVKELCNLYNEESYKYKSEELVLEILEQFLAEKKQNPDNIIN
ncbi:7629_t:CDS:1, partial [Scutellospora calospora]